MRYSLLVIATLTCILSGIAGAQDSTRIPTSLRRALQAHVSRDFIDPASAQFSYDIIRTGGPPNVRTYVVCGQVNSKNRFGGYVGRKAYVAVLIPRGNGTVMTSSEIAEDRHWEFAGLFSGLCDGTERVPSLRDWNWGH
jgi:hypothetical protein